MSIDRISVRLASIARHCVIAAVCYCAAVGSTFAADYFVSPQGDNGNDGSLAFPYATVQAALDAAVAGDNVLIRGGTYRESITVPAGHGGAPDQYVTISSYNGEPVVIKGSDVVTGWVRFSGNIWMKSGWNHNSQQVFDDGAPLQQIGMPGTAFNTYTYPNPIGSGLGDMAPGRFFFDGSALYVQLADNSDPNQSVIEASVRRRIFFSDPDRGYIRLRNITFMHSNSGAFASQDAAVTLGSHSVLDQCKIQYADLAGLSVGWATQGVQVLNSEVSHNGQLGIQAPGSEDFTIRHSLVADNNTRSFNPLWHAGGIKATTQSYGLIETTEVRNNHGTGIWADYNTSTNATIIRRNYIHDNGPLEAAVLFEASANGEIYNNVLVNNERRGIFVSGSDNVRVYNNTVVGSAGLSAIEVAMRDGVASNSAVVENNVIYDTTANVDLDMSTGSGNTSDYNLIYRASGEVMFKYDGYEYPGLSLWQSEIGLDRHSLSADPGFAIANGDRYEPGSGSPMVDAGTTLTMVSHDYREDARPAGAAYDMGAYERIPAGMNGYWPFEETSGLYTADASGNGNTGTLRNEVAWMAPGHASAGALRFDGVNDFVNAGKGASLAITGDLTISGWFRHNSAGGFDVSGVDKLGSYRLTVQEANALSSHWQFLIKGAGGALGIITTSSPVSNDQWHHVAGVYDRGAGELRIYVDGTEAASPVPFNDEIAASGLPLLIGRRDRSAYYAGDMDDIRIYNRALAAGDIASLAGDGVAAAPTPATDVIVDNRDAGITVFGAWSSSSYTDGYEGSDYLHDGNSGKGGKSVQFTPSLPATGTYEVYAKWTSESNRSTRTPIDIIHAGGMDTVVKDQQRDGGQWVLLGTYSFNAGTDGYVVIRNDGTNGYVIADAVRFVQIKYL